MEQPLPSATRSALFLMLVGTITQILSFFYRVALSRLIGAELLGLYQLLMSAYSVLIALTAMGLTAATSNLSAQYLALHDRRGADGVRRLAVGYFLLLLLPVTVIVFKWSDEISVYLLGDARTQLGLILLLPCVLLTGIENIHKHFFYGTGMVKAPAFTELAEQGVRAVAVLGLLLMLPDVYAERRVALIIIGMIICEIVSATTLVILYRHWLGRKPMGKQRGEGGEIRQRVVGMALPIGLNALLGNLIGAANATLLPQKLVEWGLSRQEAMSQFGIICGMTIPMLALPTVLLGSMNLVVVPRISRAVALGNGEAIAHYVGRTVSAVSLSMLPAMGLMAVVGGDLGVLLYGQAGVDNFLLPLVIAMILSCYQSTFCAILNGICRQRSSAIISLLCGVLQLGVTIYCVPKWGLGGYVAGVVLSAGVGVLVAGWRVAVETRVPLRLFQRFVAPALAALLMALCGNLLHRYLSDSGLDVMWSCGATSVFCGILYFAALQGQGVSIGDVIRIKK